MGQGNWLLMGEEGEIKIWWGGEFTWRVIFVGGGGRGGGGFYWGGIFGGGGGGGEGMSKFLTVGHPPIPPCRENPEPGSQA